MSDLERLLPCPFCGGEVKVSSYDRPQADVFFVNHYCHSIANHWEGKRWCSEKAAIKAWNTRAPTTKQDIKDGDLENRINWANKVRNDIHKGDSEISTYPEAFNKLVMALDIIKDLAEFGITKQEVKDAD